MITLHSLERAKERMGMNEKVAKKQIKHALERGKTADQFTSWERNYLEKEAYGNCRAIAYNGYCYIFNDDNTCVTMYSLPVWFGKKKHFDGKERIRNYKTYAKNLFVSTEDVSSYAYA